MPLDDGDEAKRDQAWGKLIADAYTMPKLPDNTPQHVRKAVEEIRAWRMLPELPPDLPKWANIAFSIIDRIVSSRHPSWNDGWAKNNPSQEKP